MERRSKSELTLEGRDDKVAAAIRVRAARQYLGLSQKDLGDAIGVSSTQITNVESAANYPSWALMVHLFRNHRIDINFIVIGAHAQLPADVLDGLLASLDAVHRATRLPVDSATTPVAHKSPAT